MSYRLPALVVLTVVCLCGDSKASNVEFAKFISQSESVSTLHIRYDRDFTDEEIINFINRSDVAPNLKVKAAHYGLDRDNETITDFYKSEVFAKVKILTEQPTSGDFEICRDLVNWDTDNLSKGCVLGYISFKVGCESAESSLSSRIWETLVR